MTTTNQQGDSMSYLTDIYQATNFEAGHERGCSFGAGADCDCSERQVIVLSERQAWAPGGELYRRQWIPELIDEAKATARTLQDRNPRATYRLRHMTQREATALENETDAWLDRVDDWATDYHPMA